MGRGLPWQTTAPGGIEYSRGRGSKVVGITKLQRVFAHQPILRDGKRTTKGANYPISSGVHRREGNLRVKRRGKGEFPKPIHRFSQCGARRERGKGVRRGGGGRLGSNDPRYHAGHKEGSEGQEQSYHGGKGGTATSDPPFWQSDQRNKKTRRGGTERRKNNGRSI